MKKNAKKFFSMLLALAMLLSMVPMTAFATETEEQAEAVVDTAVDTAEEVTATAEEAEEEEISFNFASVAPALLHADETEVDEDDPAIIALETELKEVKVLLADGSIGNLTDEQVQTILGMYQQYLDHWEENANILGVQTPFFLQYNDNEDSLGVLGEMLILGGSTVDQIRNGELTYDDITGTITTFLFADTFGVQLYGDAVKNARNEILDLIEASGAQTDVQKYMIINNWMAQNVVFDMEYIMNTDKDTNGDGVIDENDDNEDSMVAENPQEHEYYDVVYDAIYDEYKPQIEQMFRDQFYAAIVDDLRQTFYENVIRQMVYDGYLDGARASDDVVNGAKQMYYADQYEAALAEEEQKVYDEAYAAYATHEHDLTATFVWSDDNTDATATAYCETGYESYDAVIVEVESSTTAKCTEAGETTYTATATFADDDDNKVGEAYEKKTVATDALGHDYDADGVCTRCGAVGEGHQHTWNDGEVTTAAACETDGVMTYTCTSCNETKEEAIEALGHTWNEGEVTTAAACETAGVKTYTCTSCNETKEEAIEALGHSWDEGAVTTEATCGAAGVKTYTCAACDETKTEEIPATGEHVDEDADNICDVCTQEISIETEGTTETLNAEGDVDPDADNYAKKVVEEKKEEIEAAADEKANAAVEAATDETLSPYIEEIVVGDEETTTDVEAAAADYADDFMTENSEAIEAGARDFLVNFLTEQTGSADAAAQYMVDIDAQCDEFIAGAEANGLDTNGDGTPDTTIDQLVDQQMASDEKIINMGSEEEPYMCTPAEAVELATQQAAAQLTQAVLNYWQGSHFGALGRGSAVCLGYTKAFAYLVQCLHSDIYTGGASIDTASNWKDAEDLYYTNGELDVTKNYAVDCVRITFDADVTMYGEEQENFNSDHFWNAVQVDGQWYYVDPCYVDVYTEVMIRDRVETDGSNNYLYFMFSHGTAADLYDGYYQDIKTLYGTGTGMGSDTTASASPADSTAYEDSWISRVKSNIYPDDGYFYYVYDSTDMVSLMEEYENSTDASDIELSNSVMKLVRHQLDTSDSGTDGDNDYEALIEFNYSEDEDSDETVSRVKDSSGNMVENEMLTALYAQHQDDREIYPSLAITCALYNDVLYFNLSNCLLSYDLSTCEVALVKEYNTVYGVRDDTVPFGGMAFSTTTESNADFTVEDHPIAGISLKDDGNLYVSIATNFAFISGKDPHNSADQGSYGYEFEESNYNSEYNSYTNDQYDDSQYEQMGYEKEENDNDEFMWSANFVETLSMSELAGSSHNYEAVSVKASCRHNAYTENRCSDCGAIEPETRVEEADTAHEHHYLRFDETYYTKNDNGNWNTGFCYVCTECLFAIEEPTEPDPDEDYESYGTTYEEQLAIYEEEKAIYDDAVANAGHDYYAVDATWNEDYSTATFSEVICGANCPDAKLDVLIDDDTITKTFSNPATISGSDIVDYTGDCTEGAYCHYRIVGETNGITVTAETAVQLEPGEHGYIGEFTWTQVTDEDGNVVYMDNGYAQYTASAVLTCEICGDTHTDDSADITVEVIDPTIEEQGKVVYTAKAIATDDNGTQIGTASGVKEITLVASPEVTIDNILDTGKPRLKWNAVDGAVSYNIYRSDDGGETYTKVSNTTKTTIKHNSAVTGETYYYYVTAVSDDEMESDAKENVGSAICKIARTNVTLSNIASTGKIKISWEAVEGAVKYELYRSDDGGESYTKVTTTTKTSVKHTSAEAGVQYRYKVLVVAKNTEANSAFSVVKARVCDLPRTSVTLSNIESTGKIKVTWEPVEGAVKYAVYVSTDGENFEKTTNTTKTSITHSSAKAGQVYYYKIVAVSDIDGANSAPSTVKYRACDLARPDVTVKLNDKGKPVLTWNKISGTKEYAVYLSTDGENYKKVTSTSKTTVTHSSAKAGQVCYYKVRAIAEDSAANSAYSVVDSIKSK